MSQKNLSREKNLSKEAYFKAGYFERAQLFSLSEQISLIYRYTKLFDSPKIIEIGKGNGFVSDFFKKAGFDFKTFDINENLNPDVVGSVLELSRHIQNVADVVVACEVIEHLPFEELENIIKEISIVSNKYVIITLPEYSQKFGAYLQFRLPPLIQLCSIPLFISLRTKSKMPEGHFWELGYSKRTRRKNIELIFKKYFSVKEKGYFHSNPYHNYYVLEKKH